MDTEKLLKLLNENNVKYVIIGATAFPVHGYARATLDLDIFIQTDEANVKNTLKVLAEFGYDVTDIKVQDLQRKKILIRQYILETDIHQPVVTVKLKKWREASILEELEVSEAA